ncbi:hypothetical protein BDBG_17388 [Blastomyces gilchristii SLH14081]|uniref:Uncharacterized protein n=1 Tax=Blastomyces gilchristii (strain SLH14081) TaxID=559298 RepID=A0A179US60_BLAGS|nr:uncharacterized protein BDBG_17388 [Blastomyces gilchristii SLH14081]OAT10613.1 hypothetical protein BDBG_17388 [Blastomyces gilchristii SLH14081]
MSSTRGRILSVDELPRYVTPYMTILLQAERIPILHNMLAAFFTWILLAGYLVFPGTFTSMRASSALQPGADKSVPTNMVAHVVQNTPLLWIAAICCLVGACGMFWLWKIWKDVLTWVINRLIMPSFLNALIGMINTIIAVYTGKGGHWSVPAIVTASLTASSTAVMLVLFLRNFLYLRKVQNDHDATVSAGCKIPSVAVDDEHELAGNQGPDSGGLCGRFGAAGSAPTPSRASDRRDPYWPSEEELLQSLKERYPHKKWKDVLVNFNERVPSHRERIVEGIKGKWKDMKGAEEKQQADLHNLQQGHCVSKLDSWEESTISCACGDLELTCYMMRMRDAWKAFLEKDEKLKSCTDTATVCMVETLVLKSSSDDRMKIEALINKEEIFSQVTHHDDRRVLLNSLSDIPGRILSFHTLSYDGRVLKSCSAILRELLPSFTRGSRSTIRREFFKASQTRKRTTHLEENMSPALDETTKARCYCHLHLYTIRYDVAPRKPKGRRLTHCLHQSWWSKLAHQVTYLGFSTPQIHALCMTTGRNLTWLGILHDIFICFFGDLGLFEQLDYALGTPYANITGTAGRAILAPSSVYTAAPETDSEVMDLIDTYSLAENEFAPGFETSKDISMEVFHPIPE